MKFLNIIFQHSKGWSFKVPQILQVEQEKISTREKF